MALQLNRDGIRFKRANPDGKIPLTVLFAQNNDAMLGHQTHAYTIDHNFNHSRLLLSIFKNRSIISPTASSDQASSDRYDWLSRPEL